MARMESTFKINISTNSANKKLERTINLAERLNKAMQDLQHFEIELEVTEFKKKWYQFWK